MIAADLARAAIVLGMLLVRTRAMVWLVFPLLFLESTDGRLLRAGPQFRGAEHHRAARSAARQYAGFGDVVHEPGGGRAVRRRGWRRCWAATRSSC